MSEKKLMGVRVDPDLYHRIRVFAAETDRTIQDVVEEVLDKGIPKAEAKAKSVKKGEATR